MIRVTFWPGVEVTCELDDPSGVWRARAVHPCPTPEDFEVIEAGPAWTTVEAIANLCAFVPFVRLRAVRGRSSTGALGAGDNRPRPLLPTEYRLGGAPGLVAGADLRRSTSRAT